jgi:hypothetical protein
MESFNNNEFVCWNNNFCGAELDYIASDFTVKPWPGQSLNNQIKKCFLCQKDTDGTSKPFASFENKDKMFVFLKERWKDKVLGTGANGINNNSESMLKGWWRYWNNNMSDNQYETWKQNNDAQYKSYLLKVEDALKIANNPSLGLLT